MESCAKGERAAETLERPFSLHDRDLSAGVGDGDFDRTLCNQHAGAADPRLRLHPERGFFVAGNELVDDSPGLLPVAGEHVVVCNFRPEPTRRLLVAVLLGHPQPLPMQLGCTLQLPLAGKDRGQIPTGTHMLGTAHTARDLEAGFEVVETLPLAERDACDAD